ncbi:MAG: BspA family leucine-rich repeat surface protein, partial [bacterium]|nr:BspA family leucine-rich repeat surface protein [bacterium]
SESDTEQTYVVNYNSNGGTGTMGSTEFKQGESKKLTKNTFTKDGYVFKGWSTSSNSKDVAYTDEEEVSNLTNVYNGTVNLYAVWVKEGVTYEVRYDPNGGTGTMTNSSFTTGVKSKLTKNVFTKTGNIFKGWSTKLNGNVKYNDEEEVIDLSENNNTIVNLYAVWEKEEYEVNIVVQNGVINGESLKKVKYNENGIFNITPNEGNSMGIVTCTNNQNGLYQDTTLIVQDVTSDATCTVKLVNEMTTLYTDGTLIINEQLKDRTSNIEKHGEITNNYVAMDNDYQYVFEMNSEVVTSPWYNERENVKSVEIGKALQPISTSYWFYNFVNMERGDLSSWDTSKVTDMGYMFFSAGENTTTFNLDLSNWDVSNVTSMGYMFTNAGRNATTWSIGDLSEWDTSQVTNMTWMFSWVGHKATTFNLDLSNWNTSKVTDMSYMFSSAGSKATTWTVKIPSTTGSLTNTTSKWYGSSSTTYAEPSSGEYFTLS